MSEEKKVFCYISFIPKTGELRSRAVSDLVALGVVKMPRPFVGTSHAELSCIYGVVISEGIDDNAIMDYIESRNDLMLLVDEKRMEEHHKLFKELDVNQEYVELKL